MRNPFCSEDSDNLLSNSMEAKLCIVHIRNGLNHVTENDKRSQRHSKCSLSPSTSMTHLLVHFTSKWFSENFWSSLRKRKWEKERKIERKIEIGNNICHFNSIWLLWGIPCKTRGAVCFHLPTNMSVERSSFYKHGFLLGDGSSIWDIIMIECHCCLQWRQKHCLPRLW